MATIDFKALFDQSPNPYMVLDRAFRLVAMNRSYLFVTRASSEELLGRSIFELLSGERGAADGALLKASFDRVLMTREPDEVSFFRCRVRAEAGSDRFEDRLWTLVHSPLLDADGQVAFILQHVVDVTDIKGAESDAPSSRRDVSVELAVAGSHERKSLTTDPYFEQSRVRVAQAERARSSLDGQLRELRLLFEQAPGFMCLLRGRQHLCVLTNRAFLDVVGERDVLGRPFKDAFPELEGQGQFEMLDRVYATGEPFVARAMPVIFRQKGGQKPLEMYLDVTCQPMVGPDGKVIGIFVLGNDISEQQRHEVEREALLLREQEARAEAERANRLKDDFLATVSHELRTPLNAVLGWVKMLRAGHVPDDGRARVLSIIERNALAQAQVIEDLLDVSQIMAGKLSVSSAPVGMGGVVTAAIETVRPAADAKHISMQASLASDSLVLGDERRVHQIVWNILSNAVKFTPEGGCVTVTLRRCAARIELVVVDSGIGIDPAFLPHVFERFRQADGGSTRYHRGLGLGMAIVKQLVELQGGTVEASSEGKGKGARFLVSFPALDEAIVKEPGPPGSRSGPVESKSELSDLQVLVLDDEPDARDLVRVILEGHGAKVTAVGSASEAFDTLRRSRPDVVLSDLAMPDEDGYSFVLRVRGLAPAAGGNIPVAALTAHSRALDKAKVLAAGFNAHVKKPVEPRELIATVRTLAGRS